MADATKLDLAALASQTMILPLYGSSATTVTTEQAAANRSIYGTGTPAEVIASLRPGGVLLLNRIPFHGRFADLDLGSLGDASRLTDFTAGLQSVARAEDLPALLVIADQEGGRVNRLPVPPLPAAAMIGATAQPDLARRAGQITGEAGRWFGVNVVLGPVAGIGFVDRPANPPIGDRSFGSDPELVAGMVSATVEGIRSGGVAATAKHWPGLGRATSDGDTELPSLPIDLVDWETNEVRPFQAAIGAGADAVLATHESVPALDPTGEPASISAPIIDQLRSELGFDGLVISDSLWMPAIRDRDRTDAETGLAAIAAGVDCLLAPPDPRGTRRLLAGRPDLRSRLEEAVQRSIDLRERFVHDPGSGASIPDWTTVTDALTAEIGRANQE